MEHTSKHQTTSAPPRRSATRGSSDRLSTAADINAFMNGIRDKYPQQVMGVVAESSLTSGVVAATFLTILLMAACTLGPHAWAQFSGTQKLGATAKPADTQPAAVAETAPAGMQPGTTPASGDPSAQATAQTGQPAVSKKQLERMGVDEVKQSDPSVNPLDNKIDDLFDKTR